MEMLFGGVSVTQLTNEYSAARDVSCKRRLIACFQINTLSVYCRAGYTLVTLTVEMVVTIAIVHIPIAALNYFTAQCRASHFSTPQVNARMPS